jgi:hypothetical protein
MYIINELIKTLYFSVLQCFDFFLYHREKFLFQHAFTKLILFFLNLLFLIKRKLGK